MATFIDPLEIKKEAKRLNRLSEMFFIEIPYKAIISINDHAYKIKKNLIVKRNTIKKIKYIGETQKGERRGAIVVKTLPIKYDNKQKLQVNGSIEQEILLDLSPMILTDKDLWNDFEENSLDNN